MRTGTTNVIDNGNGTITITEIDIKKVWQFIHSKYPGLDPQQFVTKMYMKAAATVLKMDLEFSEKYPIEPVE